MHLVILVSYKKKKSKIKNIYYNNVNRIRIGGVTAVEPEKTMTIESKIRSVGLNANLPIFRSGSVNYT